MIFAKGMALCSLIMTGVILSVFLSGCSSPLPAGNSPGIQSNTSPIATKNESSPDPAGRETVSLLNSLHLTVHDITIQSVKQKSGKETRMAVIDLSVWNDGVPEGFSITNTSLVCIESDSLQGHTVYPDTGILPGENKTSLLFSTLANGQEKRGTVVFPLLENVKSLVITTKYPDGMIAGQVFVPDLSLGSPPISGSEYPRSLDLVVHSAVQKSSLPGMTPRPGNRIAVINVSVTNKNSSEVVIPRSQLYIQTEEERTLEHGGDRLTREMARDYLVFPLVIPPGETKSGSILYVVRSGTRINHLVLTDSNFVVHAMVDLNRMYRYE
jgi:hypothetical protein